MAEYCLPVNFDYNGRKYIASMGPFENSTEREFALTVSKKAINDCRSVDQLKSVSMNLLEGWSSMQTAVQSLTLENIQLRQAMAKRDIDMEAADELLSQATEIIEHLQCEMQSAKTKRRLWPWSK
jgi:hypothetical protein